MKQCSQNYYGNCWQNGSGHLGVSYDPATWQPVSEYSCATHVDVEEAINAAAQIGQQMVMTEFEVIVELPEPAFPSPYEQILGFQICNR